MDRTYFNQVITSESSNGMAQVSKTYNKNFIEPKKDKQVAVCVDKFKMALTSIPLMIFDNSANHYTLELTWGLFTSGRISLAPYFYSIFPAGSPFFFYIYHQSHFIDIMNQALTAGFTILSGSAGFPPAQAAPFFYCDPDTHILKLYTTILYNEGTGANKIDIFLNTTLSYQYLDGFPKVGLTDVLVPLPTGRDARLLLYNKIINTQTIGGTIYYIHATDSKQDTVLKWNICKGIVITSNLKTKTEAFPTGDVGLFYNNLQSTDILMNFDIIYNDNVKPILLNYTSYNHDKKINIMTTQDTSTVALKFYWYDANNLLYNLFIYRDDVCSVRLVFDELKKL